MCARGRYDNVLSLCETRPLVLALEMAATAFLWVKTTPFGSPVVPDV